ncbi:hypothetical protein DPMN_026226 [Dreissena polymorpha]|uniref:Uncharacterized protein n=1 Tax=Dreissena polymorpha TaxID=45954 RepID=A0A9D4LUS1_DREPO|nr:hypothetical protein DPMN_026226 [Dreissena polymorpha]
MIRQCVAVYNLSAVDINTTITLYNTTCNTSSYREIYIANKEGASTDFLYSGIELGMLL